MIVDYRRVIFAGKELMFTHYDGGYRVLVRTCLSWNRDASIAYSLLRLRFVLRCELTTV